MIDPNKPLRFKRSCRVGHTVQATRGVNRILIEYIDNGGFSEFMTLRYDELDDYMENVPEKRTPTEYRALNRELHEPSPDCRAKGCLRVIEWPEGAPLPEWPE